MVTASLTNFRIAPRKMRLVASLIKGKSVSDAENILTVTTKHSSEPLAKLLKSALANAKSLGISTDGLYVTECRVDGGVVMKRHMPVARGSAFPIKKRTSHVRLVLATRQASKKSKIESPKVQSTVVPKAEKKARAKKE